MRIDRERTHIDGLRDPCAAFATTRTRDTGLDAHNTADPREANAVTEDDHRLEPLLGCPYARTWRSRWWFRIFRLTRCSALSIVFVSQPSSSAIAS
jgi:hypothetical protein